jgi:hypothetical protein
MSLALSVAVVDQFSGVSGCGLGGVGTVLSGRGLSPFRMTPNPLGGGVFSAVFGAGVSSAVFGAGVSSVVFFLGIREACFL